MGWGERRESSWRGWRTSEGRRRSQGRGERGGGALVEAWRAKETDGIACASLLQDMGRDQGGGVGDGTGNGKEGRERERAQGMQSRFLNPSHKLSQPLTHSLANSLNYPFSPTVGDLPHNLPLHSLTHSLPPSVHDAYSPSCMWRCPRHPRTCIPRRK